mmetsp:Transcript_35489/g.35701  ORF Transcript_35489/g.35701 Transcript_35489/m.35701 type:complete len:112 (-) Transcript_35489:19-354(-)
MIPKKKSLTTLCAIFEQSIATVQNKIVLYLKKVLRRAMLRLCTKLRDEFASSWPPKQKVLRRPTKSRPPKHPHKQIIDNWLMLRIGKFLAIWPSSNLKFIINFFHLVLHFI